MSLGSRATTKGGAKGGKDTKQPDKAKGQDKSQPKEKVKPQATTEQLRIASMMDRKSDDASEVRRMVQDLMEMTRRTEEEVCSALHDADNDLQAACDLLLESQTALGEWRTSGEKKKKKPAAPTDNGDSEQPPREPRERSGPRPRRGGPGGGGGSGGGAGWGGARGGRGGGGGARGRGAGGRGAGRGGRGGRDRPAHHNNHTDNMPGGDSFPATEDWDNEEWSGSLSDTKVFTPSTRQTAMDHMPPQEEDWDTPTDNTPTTDPQMVPSFTYHNANHANVNNVQQMPPPPAAPSSAANNNVNMQPQQQQQPQAKHENVAYSQVHQQPMGMSGTLTAAQTRYLSQLTQQSQRQDNGVYAANYGVYSTGAPPDNAQRKPQRARVPPPSKIPSSAVEMPGGSDSTGGMFDVQFGALEPDVLHDEQLSPPNESQPVQIQPHEIQPQNDTPSYTTHTNTNSMASDAGYRPPHLNERENISVVETAPSIQQQPATVEPVVTNAPNVESLSSGVKQLKVSEPETVPDSRPPPTIHNHNRTKPSSALSYAAPYVPPPLSYTHHQVNSTNATMTGASAITANAYPSLSQYQQPAVNSYQSPPQQVSQQSVTAAAAAPYGTQPHAYTHTHTYGQPAAPHHKHKEHHQYDNSVSSSNSLTNTATTQPTSTAKVTTTVSTGSTNNTAAYVAPQPAALYSQTQTYAPYDESLMLRHHMGGYYEVGYGVGGAREGTFALGAGDRFARTDAASPQQVPAVLPPGYAYFYQPPPTTYQYGVYPTYGSGSSVGGVGAGKVSYTQPQPYDAQDTYKQGAAYSAPTNKAAAANNTDLSNAMYAKAHSALNKVNSYEKSGFHAGAGVGVGVGVGVGGGGGAASFSGTSHHMYHAAPPHHQHHHAHSLPHQMDVRVNSTQNRRESGTGGSGGAPRTNTSAKTYSQSYWPNN